MIKVIIAGSRTFSDYGLLAKVCDHMLQNQDEVEIVSGGAKGADSLGELYAEEKGYGTKVFKSDEATHGDSAGFLRNWAMVAYTDALIAFYNLDEDKEMLHLIHIARDAGLKIKVCEY